MQYLLAYLIPMLIILTLADIYRKELKEDDKNLCCILAVIPLVNIVSAFMMLITAIRDYLNRE